MEERAEMKRRFVAAVLCVVIGLSLLGGNALVLADALFTPGTFEGVGTGGYGGDITVSVVFEADRIVSIEVTDHSETPGIGDMGMTLTIEDILYFQTTHVDLFSGVTMTSQAVVNAVNAAIIAAGGNPDALGAGGAVVLDAPDQTVADVIIVGGGMGGLTAAIAAVQEGASVIVIDKMGFLGGSTLLSAGLISVAESRWQNENDVNFSRQDMYDYWMYLVDMNPTGIGFYDHSLIMPFINRTGPNMDWLTDLGLELNVPTGLGRMQSPLPTDGLSAGPRLVRFLEDTARDVGVDIHLNTRGVELVREADGRISGVIAYTSAGEVLYSANNAVILATGGYSASEEWMERFMPRFAPHVQHTWVAPSHMGDGFRMAEEVGAVFYDDQWLIGFAPMAVSPAILVNQDGRRYMRENWPGAMDGFLDFYTYSFNFTAYYSPEGAFEVFDSGEAFAARVEQAEAALGTPGVYRGETVAELAAAMGVPADVLQAEIDDINAVARGEAQDRLGREDNLAELVTGPFYARRTVFVDLGTIGGIMVDENYQVIDAQGSAIPGLFAVGEMSLRRIASHMYFSGLALSISLDGGIIAGRLAAQGTPEFAGSADVVIVGGGLGGLAAAISSAQNGASVIVLERMAILGGSSRFSGGGISASNTRYQHEHGALWTNDDFAAYWLAHQDYSPRADADFPIVSRLEGMVRGSADALHWLGDLGHEFAPNSEDEPWGRGRIHFPLGGWGPLLMDFMEDAARDLGVVIYTNSRGVRLVRSGGVVTGVVTEDGRLFEAYNGVVLATGGFARSPELLARFTPEVLPFIDFTTTSPGHTGDGIFMAEAVGAVAYANPWFIGAGLAPLVPGIPGTLGVPGMYVLVDQDGNRFVAETAHYSIHFNNTVFYSPEGAFMIVDSGPALAHFIPDAEHIDGVNAFTADTLADLAAAMGVSAANLQNAVDHVAAVAAGDQDDQFGRPAEMSVPLTAAPFFAIRYVPQNMGTMGGVMINQNAQVLDAAGNAIPGLFAVGEMANRPYYNQVYIGGTGLLVPLSHGITAGEVAAGR